MSSCIRFFGLYINAVLTSITLKRIPSLNQISVMMFPDGCDLFSIFEGILIMK